MGIPSTRSKGKRFAKHTSIVYDPDSYHNMNKVFAKYRTFGEKNL